MEGFLVYLADHADGQLKQAEGVSLVPRIQHPKEMCNVISAVPDIRRVYVLLEQQNRGRWFSFTMKLDVACKSIHTLFIKPFSF